MTAKIMCATCKGAGGWGCGKDAENCFKCNGSGEVPIADLPNRTAPVSGKPDALHTDYMTLEPVRSIFDKATAETRANAERGEFLANEQGQQAYSHRYDRQIAKGLGFPSTTNALAKLAALLASEPVACVSAGTLYRLQDPDIGYVGASLYKSPDAGRVGVFLAPPASPDLLTAANALATRYLKAQHDDASLCVNAAHHKAVCDLFAEIERAGKGGAQ